MATECFPAITRCFSSKTMKAAADPNKRSDSSLRFSASSFRTSGSTSSRSSCTVASPPPKRPWEEEMREVFRHFDTDSDGNISASELREYFASVEEYMSEEEAQGMIEELDSDGDGLLGFGDFLQVMGKGKGKGKGGEGDLLLKEVFGMFEQEKGSGRITPRGLQRMLGRLGDSKSCEECAAMIQIYDVDGDGHLDFQEFYQMMS